VAQTVRIYKGQEHVELDWVVGPLPVELVINSYVLAIFEKLRRNLISLEMA
jgi:lysosomal alpha-mannosidase